MQLNNVIHCRRPALLFDIKIYHKCTANKCPNRFKILLLTQIIFHLFWRPKRLPKSWILIPKIILSSWSLPWTVQKTPKVAREVLKRLQEASNWLPGAVRKRPKGQKLPPRSPVMVKMASLNATQQLTAFPHRVYLAKFMFVLYHIRTHFIS